MGFNSAPHSYRKGDIVRTLAGRIDWELDWSPQPGRWWMKSGMSGRRKLVYEHQIKPWVPGA